MRIRKFYNGRLEWEREYPKLLKEGDVEIDIFYVYWQRKWFLDIRWNLATISLEFRHGRPSPASVGVVACHTGKKLP